MRKDIFINRHKRSDLVDDQTTFLTRIEDLKLYMIEVEENGTMKSKIYPSDCEVRGNDRRPIIVITNDEYTFSANDGIWRAWTRTGNIFSRPKNFGQDITTSEFLFLFSQLNLAPLNLKKKTK